jgi:hypothetical protein
MKVELPGESKAFGDIIAGECFAFSHRQITSVCMKVEWYELAGSILHSLPSAVFIASVIGNVNPIFWIGPTDHWLSSSMQEDCRRERKF